MGKSLIVIIILFLSNTIYCQDSLYKREFALSSGYHNPIGFIGLEFGIRPKLLNSVTQYNVGFGLGSYQFFKFSQSINIYPFKEKKVIPFLKVFLSEAIKQDLHFEADNVSTLYTIKNNFYITPTASIRIKTKSKQINYNFFAGYSFLLNKPDIKFVYGNPVFLNRIEKNINGGPVIIFSLSSLL